ncbi:hypothetical protein HHL19_35560 [Streptomyces sp. R302]|uniref:hypothetical protein n=1 Tax=unclassified Streptomyces TaxID=2593676 RepID=UPI00145D30CD|nr:MULTISPECIES: hypothetical protein [unclassified Streptomyces]NML55142.1 hypothetical protein [Streptomyces sp. R301]NML83828.1 hypothetical protein [Streptomyces sp. R302]
MSAAPAPIEYLYGIEAGHEFGNDWIPTRVIRFRITKKTPRRVYYLPREFGRLQERFVDRAVLERDGEVWRKSAGWWEPDIRVYLNEPVLETAAAPDLGALKAAMAAAHPDRGGTDEEFIAARRRYEQARARAGTQQ